MMHMTGVTSNAAVSEPTRSMVEAALAWHLRLQDEHANATARQGCKDWCAAHPAHALAYARIESLWKRFDDLEPAPSMTALQAGLHTGKRLSRRLAAGSVAFSLLLAATLALANLFYGGLSPTALLADYRTGAGEQKTIVLADNSRMILNSRSAVDVEYSGAERRIVLREGEILVEVAKDAARPFVVATAEGTAQALGTRYIVRQENGATLVTVTESVVRACATHTVSACVDLHAGEQAGLHADRVSGIQRVDVLAAESWSTGSLLVDDLPLIDVLAELARHRPGLLRFDASALAGQRVSGVFPLHDTDKALEVIAATQPVTVKRFTPWVVTIEPR